MLAQNNFFSRSLIYSLLFHIVILLIVALNPLTLFHKLPSEPEQITFEVAFTSDFTNIKSQPEAKKRASKATQDKSKEIKKSVSKKLAATTPQEQPKKTEPIKKAEQQKIVAIKEQAPKKTDIKDVAKKEQKKPSPQKPVATKKQAEVDPLDSILKNLDESSGNNQSQRLQQTSNQSEKDQKFFKSDRYNDQAPISVTEKNMIRKTIEKNWHKPTSLPLNNQIQIWFHLELEKNGQLKQFRHIKTLCSHSAEICRIALDSVERALNRTKSIENLSIERYHLWKSVELHFDLELM